MTKEEKCKILSELYGWDYHALITYNDGQIDILFSACKDEEGNLRKRTN